MNEGIYYLKVQGQVEGPLTIGQIYDLWAARKINSQTLFARYEEMDKWKPLSELTLKISAPRTATTSKETPATEPAAATQSRGRQLPNFKPEEYFPTLPYAEAPRAEAGPKRKRAAWSGWAVAPSLAFSSVVCVLLGVGVMVYGVLFLPVSMDGKVIDPNLLAMKQAGVIAGVGLLLMGGLLTIARRVERLIALQEAGLTKKTDSKTSARESSSAGLS